MKTPFKFITFVLLVFFAFFANQQVQAQLLVPKAEQTETKSGLDQLLGEARQDGSTVIVISPANKAADQTAANSNARAEMFLKARKRIKEIVSTGPVLIGNLIGTLKEASPDGTWFWLFRALGTALLGLVVGWYATRPIVTWSMQNILVLTESNPETTADKISYLLTRALFALVYVIIYFAVAMVIAVVLDSGHEPSRRVIFEVVAWYCVYRFLRHGVSWNIFAGGMAKYRLVNLSDEEAVKLHRDWHIGVAIFACFAAFARFSGFTGTDQLAAGFTGGLTVENIKLLQISSAMLASFCLVVYVLKDWKSWQHIFAPSEPTAQFYTLRRRLARLVPPLALTYALVAMGMFVFRLALDMPSPGVVIVAPFAIFYIAIVVYGLILILIQAFYNRRIRRFQELAAAERERAEQAAVDVDTEASEEMEVGPSSVTSAIFEYQPMFRGLFEYAALAVVAAV